MALLDERSITEIFDDILKAFLTENHSILLDITDKEFREAIELISLLQEKSRHMKIAVAGQGSPL